MDGTQSVSRLPEVGVVVLSQYDVELLEQPLQEEILEEEAGLLSSGANFQHDGQQLRRCGRLAAPAGAASPLAGNPSAGET